MVFEPRMLITRYACIKACRWDKWYDYDQLNPFAAEIPSLIYECLKTGVEIAMYDNFS